MVTPPAPPPAPTPQGPPDTWEHGELYRDLRKALFVLPSLFTSELNITGVLATDLHTFNSSLGATIEAQVVGQLNEARALWDPEGAYAAYRFVRQAQRFPDVILEASDPDAVEPILLGIELKGWYILAKEGEPSFRYRVTPAVCAPWDLLVVYPWALSSVTAGSPALYTPHVVEARFAAEYRNWWWQHGRKERTPGKSGLRLSAATGYYPDQKAPILDVPDHDTGGNFGRYSRSGIMDEYIRERFSERLLNIPVAAWQRFFRIFAENRADESVLGALERLAAEFAASPAVPPPASVAAIAAQLTEIADLIRDARPPSGRT